MRHEDRPATVYTSVYTGVYRVIDPLPSRALVAEAVATTVESFDDEMTMTVHGMGCPGDDDGGCTCGARELLVPGETVDSIWWWMRRLAWRMTRQTI